MLHWSALHPYNAAHIYHLAGPLDLESLRNAIRETYLAHDLGIAQLSDDGRSYRHEMDLAPEVELVPGGPQADISLAEHVSRQLNRPFERPTCKPFRFSVVDAGPQSHYVAVSYDHWVADSVASRLLLRNVLGRYLHLAIPENDLPLDLYPGTYREVLGHRLHGLKLAGAAARAVGQSIRNRRARRVACWPSTQWAVNYHHYSIADGTAPRLRQFARSLGATVHDVVLAALGRAMAEFMPSRGKCRDLALGSIVDSRGAAEVDLSQTVGAFLAYYLVRTRPSDSPNLAEAARRIAALTGPIKARQRYVDSVVNMSLLNMTWPWLSENVRAHCLHHVLPMTGGISNVWVREPWIDQNRHAILDYRRVAPTGPMVPLVITPTTLGDQMNMGVTYRTAGFSQEKIDGIMALLLEQLEHPDETIQRRRRGRTIPAGTIVRQRLRMRRPSELAGAASSVAYVRR
jgi:NRPS condensation-like uncharacterized protein